VSTTVSTTGSTTQSSTTGYFVRVVVRVPRGSTVDDDALTSVVEQALAAANVSADEIGLTQIVQNGDKVTLTFTVDNITLQSSRDDAKAVAAALEDRTADLAAVCSPDPCTVLAVTAARANDARVLVASGALLLLAGVLFT